MSSNRATLPLMAVPVIIGLIAGIAGYWDQMVSIFWWVCRLMVGLFVAWVVLKLIARSAPAKASKPDLLHPQRDTELENGWYERIDKSTVHLHADGYVFELKNKGGRLHWRELDPQNRTPLEKWISAHPRNMRGEKKIAAEHIKTRVNARKGL